MICSGSTLKKLQLAALAISTMAWLMLGYVDAMKHRELRIHASFGNPTPPGTLIKICRIGGFAAYGLQALAIALTAICVLLD